MVAFHAARSCLPVRQFFTIWFCSNEGKQRLKPTPAGSMVSDNQCPHGWVACCSPCSEHPVLRCSPLGSLWCPHQGVGPSLYQVSTPPVSGTPMA